MSETSGAATSAVTTSGMSESSATPNQNKSSSEQVHGFGETKAKAEGESKAKAQETDSEFDEVKIGSVSGKVPKEIAKAIKNLERGFHSKAQELAAREKLVQLGKENPKEFFKQTGIDAYELAESLLAEKYELMQMSPEQRKLRELEAWKQEQEQREQGSKAEVLQALKEFGPLPEGAEKASKEQLIQYLNHQKQTYQKEWSTLDQQIGEAFKESGIPADKYVIAKVAFEMSSALKRGKSLTAAEALAKVKGEYFGGVKNLFANMDAKKIHELVGDEFFDKLRKYDLDQVNAQASSKFGTSQQTGQAKASSQTQERKKPMNEFEWRKFHGY